MKKMTFIVNDIDRIIMNKLKRFIEFYSYMFLHPCDWDSEIDLIPRNQ